MCTPLNLRIQEAEADKSLNSQTARTSSATQQNPVLKNQKVKKKSITVSELRLTFLSFLYDLVFVTP